MRKNKKIMLSLSICSIVFFITILIFIYLKSINFYILRTAYLPIYLIILISILFKQFIFSYIFTSSVVIGLIVEYLIHQQNQTYPNMKGAFSNTAILLIGVVVGIVIQLFFKRKKKDQIH